MFRNTHQEVPYSTAVEIEQFTEEERDDGVPFAEIFARILVERKQQKGIIIGKQGTMLEGLGPEPDFEIAPPRRQGPTQPTCPSRRSGRRSGTLLNTFGIE